MTDLLTIVFTGLVIIHPSGEVNAIKADNHTLTVKIGAQSYEAKDSISFQGVEASAEKLTGQMPPDLSRVFSTSSEHLSVNEAMAISFRIPGGRTSLGGESVTCEVGGMPVVFSQGVV